MRRNMAPAWASPGLWLAFLLVLACQLFTGLLHAASRNGFDVSAALVPQEEIVHGGPPRDGIPAIDRPQFVEASDVNDLGYHDRVLGINRNGIQKAYPVGILDYHEIGNDHFGNEAVAVTYCPLCGTGMAFIASVDGVVHDFGVSGLLYKNDVLLYDRQTGSLWSQLMKQAVTGPMRGKRLQQVVMAHTTWGGWRKTYPRTQVLSTDTGFSRNYRVSPYAGYADSETLYFPLSDPDRRYHPKELVIGITLNGQHKAYPFVELSSLEGALHDRMGGQDLTIVFDAENRSGWILNEAGEAIPSTIVYWFAWQAFHPDSLVYRAR